MKQFIPWIGGKGALINEILPRFPTNNYRYVEVFSGGGWATLEWIPFI